MAQSTTTDSSTLIIPDAYASWKVAPQATGLAINGVLMLIGEADAGPDYSLESDLGDNAFAPADKAVVQAKYRSGPLVDAFAAAVQPFSDPQVVGSFSRAIICKTNASAKAKATLVGVDDTVIDNTDYLDIADKSYGKAGNLIYYTVSAQTSEVIPTTGPFTLLVPGESTNVGFRVNGGAEVSATLAAADSPATMVSNINGLAGVTATGGADRGVLAASQVTTGTLTVDATANVIVITIAGNTWAVTPSAGDTLYIPSGSAIEGASNLNRGSYVVTGATTSTITATKLLDAGASTLTAPEDVAAPVDVAATTDVQCYAPVTISIEGATVLNGKGKALEVLQLTSGTGVFEDLAYALSTTPVTWISKSGDEYLLTSASEYRTKLVVARDSDSVSETLVAGGEIALKLGYTGTTATVTITDTTLSTTVVGGAGTSQSLTLADFPTIKDVVTFLNSKPGYTASVGTAILGQLPSTALDNVSGAGICTGFGVEPGRIKIDGYRFYNKVTSDSVLVQLQGVGTTTLEQAGSGLPAVTSGITYLDGGTRGGTTQAQFQAALDALELVQGNFVVSCFAQDANDDKLDGVTDSSSTYLIEDINAAINTHALALSTEKRGRHRQAFGGFKGSFTEAKAASANIGSYRAFYGFQDVRVPGADGVTRQYQPWMAGVKAAAGQAAAFRNGIFNKTLNIGGALMADGSFSDQRDSDVEDALLAGLSPIRKRGDGTWAFASDQTSYGTDSNFVLNSVQAVYVSDIITLDLRDTFRRSAVGQSVADFDASLGLTLLRSRLSEYLRRGLIAASDDAPLGYENPRVQLAGPTLRVSVNVKLAGLIYFVPIAVTISQVSQTV